jgi:hypothetical protein
MRQITLGHTHLRVQTSIIVHIMWSVLNTMPISLCYIKDVI